MFDDGAEIKEVAKGLGISGDTACNYKYAHNMLCMLAAGNMTMEELISPPRSAKKTKLQKLTKEEKDYIIKEKVSFLAAKYGVNERTVKKWRRAIREENKKDKEVDKEVIEFIKDARVLTLKELTEIKRGGKTMSMRQARTIKCMLDMMMACSENSPHNGGLFLLHEFFVWR